jgi:pilus assembly protein CpaC
MSKFILDRGAAAVSIAALLAASVATAIPAPALAQSASIRPAGDMELSVGTGRMIRLDRPISDLFVADDKIADVQVRSANQIYVFAKAAGETTVYATDRAGHTVFSTAIRVGTNLGSVSELLRQAMPEAQIEAHPINGTVLLTGTVAAPEDVAEATRLVQAFVGQGTDVISRLKTATPQQVMLQVKIAEVSRSLVKNIGVNLLNRDTSGGFLFGIGQGSAGTIRTVTGGVDPTTGAGAGGTAFQFNNATSGTTLGAAGHLLGMDLLSTLNLSEDAGKVRMLAEPNLTALSGETASFLAGGEFPVLTTSVNGTNVDYKQYGVSLAFTPTVLDGGRISMRVRPEVSELSAQGAVTLNGTSIPALTTRRAETTVELGSGQSFMIGGLMRNNSTNSINKAPFLGSIPILGALFRSNSFQRDETELVIIVTPYLVRPVNASQIALPTDGFREATTAQRVFLNTDERGQSGAHRPVPTIVPAGAAPAIGAADSASPPTAPPPQRQARAGQQAIRPSTPSPAPGFSF